MPEAPTRAPAPPTSNDLDLDTLAALLAEYSLSTSDVARAIGQSRTAVGLAARAGRLPHLRISSGGQRPRLRFRPEDVAEYVRVAR